MMKQYFTKDQYEWEGLWKEIEWRVANEWGILLFMSVLKKKDLNRIYLVLNEYGTILIVIVT